MIAVDTSVWVAFFRGQPEVVASLTEWLDRDQVALPIAVRVEILSGVRQAEHKKLARILSALPVLYPSDGTWSRIDGWVTDATRRGQRFGFADLLIAALATEHHCKLWSNDTDFHRMHRLGWFNVING